MEQSSTSLKKYSLELGGNAPVVVMPDADLDEVAANIVAKKVGFAGQTCVNYNRIYIQSSIYEELCEKIASELKKVKLGRWKDEGYVMGPVIDNEARDRMLDLIKDATDNGATLVMGGEIQKEFEKGSYITPALLKGVNDEMRVSKEEIFGPIIPIQSFETLDEAIEKANNTIFGLSAANTIVNDFKFNNVDTDHLIVEKGKRSNFCICITERSTKSKHIISRGGELREVDFCDINEEYIKSARMIHVGFVNEAVRKAADIMHQNGGKVSVDAAYLNGMSVPEAARFATGVSTIKCTQMGGRAGIPNREILDVFLETGEIDKEKINKRAEKYSHGLM